METINNLKQRFLSAGMLEKLIYINIAVFIIGLLTISFSGLYGTRTSFLTEWFALPSDLDKFITRPWSLVSYGFLHAGFLHILFNCIWLYIFGRLFIEYFTDKQLLNFYLLGTVFGGMAFLIAMNYFPIFSGAKPPIVGASAGISAIIIGTATHIPNYELRIPLINIYIKVWHLALFFILMDLISLSGGNGGGHFSHLGGALFGFLYVKYAGNKELDIFPSFKRTSKKKKTNLKTVHKSNNLTPRGPYRSKSDQQKKIDIILEKIGDSGYDSLTQEEKDFLFEQGKK
ncbi:rhomboid family intramembrane serine protease [Tenacibaculum jejuense]|uniref:Rhomboid family protein n=1 Tax=Tenacibaculum jejuense TaxID=584609 RepID=A0A238UE25_9FLAO|nr:rhomboid family intramembrane serine protease [Tenacibaculum jejuense]SNR16838.1 Rhomboid family protein [Tenacibaculum jejuense]